MAPESFHLKNVYKPLIAIMALLTMALLPSASAAPPKPILDYIRDTWAVLTRTHKQLAAAAVDPKFKPGEDGKWLVYIPSDENVGLITKRLRAEMPAVNFLFLVAVRIFWWTTRVLTDWLFS